MRNNSLTTDEKYDALTWQRQGRVRRRVAAVALSFLAGGSFAGGALADKAAHHANLQAQVKVANAAKLDFANRQSVDLEAHHSIKLKESNIGEKCVMLIAPYRNDGALADTHEDEVVDDVLRNPSLGCGNDPTTIRGEVRVLRGADAAVADADKLLLTSKQALDHTEHSIAGDTAPDIAWGIVGGFVVGAVVGIPFDFAMYEYATRKQYDKA